MKMAKKTSKSDRPEDYTGPRTPTRSSQKCGWCLGQPPESEEHQKCKRELAWYEKLYVCGCACADEHWERATSGKDDNKTKRAASESSGEPPEASDEAGSEPQGH